MHYEGTVFRYGRDVDTGSSSLRATLPITRIWQRMR